ncbi:MAG: hypothetical protein ONB44_21125 [candidate division KSB1 bacterium]|nr:hypothetical protein [candidate division KSB1 bacterium]MDZ7304637.1 hypothetical protein [candidate division KSB1 bacterium]MDZ7313769.1 hypothetical protein [candidate division KSB1 bacterium]
MRTQKLRQLAEDPRFISGIYNYCDRWCERCPFTSRCLVYAQEEQDQNDPAAHDITNEAFWKKLGDIFEQTKEMLYEMAKERGIDLDASDYVEVKRQERRHRKKAEHHELARAASTYGKMVDEWFETEQALFMEKEQELNTMLQLEISGHEPHRQAASIVDAVEVIRWYQHQIYVKLMRALMQDDFELLDDEGKPFPKDSDGSAKVALIAMDRSIAAWGTLHEHFPEKTDSILNLLLQLDRLRRKTEQHFPNARSFVRPGFDTVEA